MGGSGNGEIGGDDLEQNQPVSVFGTPRVGVVTEMILFIVPAKVDERRMVY